MRALRPLWAGDQRRFRPRQWLSDRLPDSRVALKQAGEQEDAIALEARQGLSKVTICHPERPEGAKDLGDRVGRSFVTALLRVTGNPDPADFRKALGYGVSVVA